MTMLQALRRSRRARPVSPTRIRVRGGYHPDTVHARVGEPVRLIFRREETAPCSERIVFPDFGKSAMLPTHEDVTIELAPERSGTYEFTCQMDMLHGRLIVEELRRAAGAGAGPVTAIAEAAALRPLQRIARQAWGALVAAWGGFIGLLPHVLHHVGPLAGAALLAGAAGTALFAAIGFVAATPFLLRLHRRFQSWRAPTIALAVFAVMFSLSSFVIGPAIAGEDSPATPQPEIEQPPGHEQHH